MTGEAADGGDQERVEGAVGGGHECLEGAAHARVPEGLDVARDGLGRLVGRQVGELTGDVVAQAGFRGADSRATLTRGSPRARRALGDAWSPRALATPTCTAVTLYSGQLVAQSEFSVVTTLAPVTGWWKVV